METTDQSLFKAKFNELVKPYMMLYVGSIFLATVIGIVFLPFWFLGVGQWWSRHYYDKLECELTERAIRFKKGILVQVEKTIPLENIQDVTFVEGPLLKYFHLCILKFETAGQSAGQAHDMQLIGIINAHELRNLILSQREKRMMAKNTTPANPVFDNAVVLQDIKELLSDIKGILQSQRVQ
ncbi:PH domain-containing protein [Runella sp.]|uniref:PH domain-containing protein n=1 Tax=Runella sp. TaxID=1960881 RepID=UPI003D121995